MQPMDWEMFEQIRDNKRILRQTGWLDSNIGVGFGQKLNARAESGVAQLVLDFSELESITGADAIS